MRLGVKYKGDLKVTTDDTPTENQIKRFMVW